MITSQFNTIATRHPDAIALIDGPVRLTYARLNAMHERLASYFAGRFRPARGARIAVILPNCWQFVASFLAIARLGGICVPLNPQWKSQELKWCMEQLQFAAVITQRAFAGPWREFGLPAPDRQLLVDETPIFHSVIDDPSAEVRKAPAADGLLGGDEALYLATSGSTGRPKFVVRTHQALMAGARNVAQSLQLIPGQRFLSVVPFHHANGFSNCMLLPLLHGATAILLPRFTPAALAEQAQREKAQVLIGSPFIFRMLLESEVEQGAFASVDTCLSSGAAMSQQLVERCRDRLGLRVRQLYGTSETGTVAIEPDRNPPVEGLVGKPISPVAVRILDPAGRELPAQAIGEVAVRSPAMMKGYHGEGRSSASLFHDGFFRTADLGKIDSEGNLILCGRAKRMINLAGIKVDPVEIENALQQMEGVVGCVVGPFCDRRGQETVKAVIAVRPGRSLTRGAVVEHCRNSLAEYKIPRIIELVDELPWDLMGKNPIGREE